MSPVIPYNGWLLDEDGQGLLRASTSNRRGLGFGPAHDSRLSDEDRIRYEAMLDGESIIGIAVEPKDYGRVGPYWYKFDAREPIIDAVDRAGKPKVTCQKGVVYNRGYACKPESKLPWIGAQSVAFGSDAENLDQVFQIDYDVTKFLLSECDYKATFCEPFSFNVPKHWGNVYFQIKDRDGIAQPIERVQIDVLNPLSDLPSEEETTARTLTRRSAPR
jgi:hypothetical protein